MQHRLEARKEDEEALRVDRELGLDPCPVAVGGEAEIVDGVHVGLGPADPNLVEVLAPEGDPRMMPFQRRCHSPSSLPRTLLTKPPDASFAMRGPGVRIPSRPPTQRIRTTFPFLTLTFRQWIQ